MSAESATAATANKDHPFTTHLLEANTPAPPPPPQYTQGLREGHGVHMEQFGDEFRGEFKNGQYHGYLFWGKQKNPIPRVPFLVGGIPSHSSRGFFFMYMCDSRRWDYFSSFLFTSSLFFSEFGRCGRYVRLSAVGFFTSKMLGATRDGFWSPCNKTQVRAKARAREREIVRQKKTKKQKKMLSLGSY
jgi:hypothetical protein